MEMFEGIMQGLQESLEYSQGKLVAKKTTMITFEPLEDYTSDQIRDIRIKSGMTQKSMSEYVGVSQKTVEAWERGTNTPSGPARRLLSLLNNASLEDIPFVTTV